MSSLRNHVTYATQHQKTALGSEKTAESIQVLGLSCQRTKLKLVQVVFVLLLLSCMCKKHHGEASEKF